MKKKGVLARYQDGVNYFERVSGFIEEVVDFVSSGEPRLLFCTPTHCRYYNLCHSADKMLDECRLDEAKRFMAKATAKAKRTKLRGR